MIQLTGIRIDAPLTQYHVGGTIPLHVNGYADDQNPMSFGGTVPGLIFKWESGNPSVVKLHTVHSKVVGLQRLCLLFCCFYESWPYTKINQT